MVMKQQPVVVLMNPYSLVCFAASTAAVVRAFVDDVALSGTDVATVALKSEN